MGFRAVRCCLRPNTIESTLDVLSRLAVTTSGHLASAETSRKDSFYPPTRTPPGAPSALGGAVGVHIGWDGDMHTDPSHRATVQPSPHRHLDRTRRSAATCDPRRRSPCAWRATSHHA